MKRLLRSIAMMLISSIIFSIIHVVFSMLFDGTLSNGALRMTKLGALRSLNPYEMRISQHIIQAANIDVHLADIGGLSTIKRDIQTQVLLPLKHPHIFFADAAILHPPRGLLLHGPPGVGKTMLAKAIAADANVPFLSLSLSSLENKYFGETSKLLSAAFSLARKIQPCIVFFDEIDGMIRKRSELDHSAVYGFKTEFLAQLDGMHTSSRDSVITIACTNCIDKLDPAVRRRLPKTYQVDYPSAEEQADILRLQLAKHGMGDEGIARLCAKLKGTCSGSDIVDAVRIAWSDHVQRVLESPAVAERLQQPTTKAADIVAITGSLSETELLDAFRRQRLLNRTPPPEATGEATVDDTDDDDEAPPQEVAGASVARSADQK